MEAFHLLGTQKPLCNTPVVMAQKSAKVESVAYRCKGYLEGLRSQPKVDMVIVGVDVTLKDFMKQVVKVLGCKTLGNQIKQKPILTYIYSQDGNIKALVVDSHRKLKDLPNVVSFNPVTHLSDNPINLFHLNYPEWGVNIPFYNTLGFFNHCAPLPTSDQDKKDEEAKTNDD